MGQGPGSADLQHEVTDHEAITKISTTQASAGFACPREAVGSIGSTVISRSHSQWIILSLATVTSGGLCFRQRILIGVKPPWYDPAVNKDVEVCHRSSNVILSRCLH